VKNPIDLASILGLLIAFGLGFKVTSKLLKVVANGKFGIRLKNQHFFKRRNSVIINLAGGLITTALYVFLLYQLPMGSFLPILVFLLVGGFYYIFLKFLNKLSSKSISKKNVPPPIYPRINSQPKEDVKASLEKLTMDPNWDWECFRSVLICLVKMGTARYIPANSRPDQISLDGLQTTFSELRHISVRSSGRETSRAVFVDKARSCLVISGKTHIGTIRSVKIDMETQPGRQYAQLPVLTIHVHPSMGSSEGFSDIDYTSFLSDNRLIVMIICYQGGVFLALKTSATSKNIAASTAQHMISTIRHDILRIWSNLNIPNSILAFNKAVCMEFGMTLYQTSGQVENTAHRIEVTNL
jgi:hypothetical protein